MVELAAKNKQKEMLLRSRRTVYNWLECLVCILHMCVAAAVSVKNYYMHNVS